MSKSSTETSDIDFVITWVDGTDPAWLDLKETYSDSGSKNLRQLDSRDVRYRPWDTLKFLFRGIDAFAPWVRKVHFVTWGHLPSWLDTSNPKLNVVNHGDYIPQKYLPTFSSRTIEFNFHRIPDLAEHFVNFNDDMMIIKPVGPDVFFHDGLPCDSAVLSPYRVKAGDWFYAPVTNNAVIGKYFSARKSVRSAPLKWLNFKYGKDLFRTITMLPYPWFYGFMHYHIPDSFLKSTFDELWQAEHELLDDVCTHRFRVSTDPNQWLFQEWQLASGTFYPRRTDIGEVFQIVDEDTAKGAAAYISSGKGKFICLNDNLSTEANAILAEKIVITALQGLLPARSSFELNDRD